MSKTKTTIGHDSFWVFLTVKGLRAFTPGWRTRWRRSRAVREEKKPEAASAQANVCDTSQVPGLHHWRGALTLEWWIQSENKRTKEESSADGVISSPQGSLPRPWAEFCSSGWWWMLNPVNNRLCSHCQPQLALKMVDPFLPSLEQRSGGHWFITGGKPCTASLSPCAEASWARKAGSFFSCKY